MFDESLAEPLATGSDIENRESSDDSRQLQVGAHDSGVTCDRPCDCVGNTIQ